MTLEQRFEFHTSLRGVMENKDLSDHDRSILSALSSAIYDMCRCWPCTTHESEPAIYLGCEFCKVCSQHAHSLDVYSDKQ
jgi:hypothetical protein